MAEDPQDEARRLAEGALAELLREWRLKGRIVAEGVSWERKVTEHLDVG